MRHRRTRRRIQRNFSHRKQMLENMVNSLFHHQMIRTTWVKAKEAQRLADRLISLGKRGTLHSRRQAYAILGNRQSTLHLFNDIAPRFKERQGGYTRVLHHGVRKGDGASLAVLELTERVDLQKEIKPSKDKKAKELSSSEEAKKPGEIQIKEKKREPAQVETKTKAEPFKKEIKPRTGFFRNLKHFFRRKSGG